MSNPSPERAAPLEEVDIITRLSTFVLACIKTEQPRTAQGSELRAGFALEGLSVDIPNTSHDTLVVSTRHTPTSRGFPQYHFSPLRSADLNVRSRIGITMRGLYGRHIQALRQGQGIFSITPTSEETDYIPGWEMIMYRPSDVGRFTKMGRFLQDTCLDRGTALTDTVPFMAVLFDTDYDNSREYTEPSIDNILADLGRTLTTPVQR